MKVKFTKSDILLILGALRRAFARSDIHKRIKESHKIEHVDPRRPRCKNWSWCNTCGEVVPTWKVDVNHIDPVTPLDKYTYEMDPHEILDRIWCADNNLDLLCHTCHDKVSAEQRAAKREYRKANKK